LGASGAAADGEESVSSGSGFLSALALALAVSPGFVPEGLGYGVGEGDLAQGGLAVVLLVLLEGLHALLGNAVAEGVVEGAAFLGESVGQGLGYEIGPFLGRVIGDEIGWGGKVASTSAHELALLCGPGCGGAAYSVAPVYGFQLGLGRMIRAAARAVFTLRL
jgi:hypothetical protein